MGHKKVLEPYNIFDAQAVTGSNTYNSNVVNVKNIDNLAIDISWTGTCVGSFLVRGSVDGTNYRTLTFDATLPTPSGTAGGFMLNIKQNPFQYIKAVYTNSSSSGTVTAVICGKDLN